MWSVHLGALCILKNTTVCACRCSWFVCFFSWLHMAPSAFICLCANSRSGLPELIITFPWCTMQLGHSTSLRKNWHCAMEGPLLTVTVNVPLASALYITRWGHKQIWAQANRLYAIRNSEDIYFVRQLANNHGCKTWRSRGRTFDAVCHLQGGRTQHLCNILPSSWTAPIHKSSVRILIWSVLFVLCHMGEIGSVNYITLFNLRLNICPHLQL